MSVGQKYTSAFFRLIGLLCLLGLILVFFAEQTSWKPKPFTALAGGSILLLGLLWWFASRTYELGSSSYWLISELWRIHRGPESDEDESDKPTKEDPHITIQQLISEFWNSLRGREFDEAKSTKPEADEDPLMLILGRMQENRNRKAKPIFRTDSSENFILLLRPFKTGGKKRLFIDWLGHPDWIKIESANHMVLFQGIHDQITIEPAVNMLFEPIAPLIAAHPPGMRQMFRDPYGRPGETSLGRHTWQNRILNAINRAALIILIPGWQRGVLWELRQIQLHEELRRKAFIFVPPISDISDLREWDLIKSTIRSTTGLELPHAAGQGYFVAINDLYLPYPLRLFFPFTDKSLTQMNQLIQECARIVGLDQSAWPIARIIHPALSVDRWFDWDRRYDDT